MSDEGADRERTTLFEHQPDDRLADDALISKLLSLLTMNHTRLSSARGSPGRSKAKAHRTKVIVGSGIRTSGRRIVRRACRRDHLRPMSAYIAGGCASVGAASAT